MSMFPFNNRRIVNPIKITIETPTAKSIYFRDMLTAKGKPGQFMMVWIPDVDEVPMSLSRIGWKNGISAITVKKVGEASSAIQQLDLNTPFGVRGPYGKGFTAVKGKVLLCGGGVGVAALLPLIEKLSQKRSNIKVVAGAENAGEILAHNMLNRRLGKNFLPVTEDGSMGFKGIATDILPELFKTESYRQVYACGPELMLKKVLSIAAEHHVPVQLSLERYIKCSIGLCGSCMIDGLRVCREGPVFTGDQLRGVSDFGAYRRGKSGKILCIGEGSQSKLKKLAR